jgi:UDP-glucuronate decarboxylase
MRVLVTGGAGFLGSHLCERLLWEGHVVTCLDNFSTGDRANLSGFERIGQFDILAHDICDPIPDRLAAFDEIYHLACPASPVRYQADPLATMRACADGTRHVLERALRDGARLFHASTSEIYGDPTVHPQTEAYTGNVETIGPRACYDEGKRYAETLLHVFVERFGVEARIARLFNSYGPRMRFDDGRLISNIMAQVVLGEDLTVYGDGTHTRSLCYVDDTIEGIVRLCRSNVPPAMPVNIGNPVEMRVIDIATAVLAVTGGRSRICHRPLPVHDPARRRPDIARAQLLLGWSPQVSLEEGLARTLEDFRRRLNLTPRLEAAA